MMQWLLAALLFAGAGFILRAAAGGVFSSRRGAENALLFTALGLAAISLVCIGLVAFAGVFPGKALVLLGAGAIVVAGVGKDVAGRIGRKRLVALKDTVAGWLTHPVGGNDE